MPRVKIPRKSTLLDMTAMCDVAFLLLTFFMLTSNFTKKEPAIINTPQSISEIKIPERNIMIILVDAKGKVFFGIDGQDTRDKLLTKIGESYSIIFTPQELKEFSLINSFGVPINQMKTFLDMKPEDRDKAENAVGIPCDSINNEFKSWVSAARSVMKEGYRIAIKGDKLVTYPVIKKLMGTLQTLNENRYNLITSLESEPVIEKP
jgi:biopolymer transport protein ExbD